MIKPKRLRRGSRVAAVSLSWGGPGAFPHRYAAGKRQFEEEFGVAVTETAHALREPEWLARNPRARADDLMAAFADPNVDGIIATIGGDDSIRLLPYLDVNVIRANPKVLMGYSDTTVTHCVCRKAGVVSFYGPSFMAGFGENAGMFGYMVDSVRRTLFGADPIGLLPPNESGWTVEQMDWADPASQSVARTLDPCTGPVFHQHAGVAEGTLFGGCVEVLDWLRGTPVFPSADSLRGAILALETSEEAPPPEMLRQFLRSLAAMGCLQPLAGILLGRPGGQLDPALFPAYADTLCRTVREEYGLVELLIVSNVDFGHTDPMMVLPLGVRLRIDSERRE
ncbi:MAG: LD-carboxypeptidase, partial [bacterium]|nr:LD-carboxypeptidase [bacterium]